MVESINEELLNQAGQYVLGTLDGRERADFELQLERSDDLRAAVMAWEERLAGLNELTAPVPPPARVWTRIQARLDPGQGRERRGWWQSVLLWRSIAALAVIALVVVSVPLVVQQPVMEQPPVYNLVLRAEDQQPQWMVSVDWRERRLAMTRVAAETPPADKAHELWLVPTDDRPPVSLGLLTGERVETQLPAQSRWSDAKAFAVSLEPAGGSPTGQPTGPVLYAVPVPI